MALYSLIFLDQNSEIADMAEIRCDTDEQAIAEAQNRANGCGVVILQGDCYVDAIEGSGS